MWIQTNSVEGKGSNTSNYLTIPSNCNEFKIVVGVPKEEGILMEQTFVQTQRTISRIVQFGGAGNSTSGGHKIRCIITKDNKVYLKDAYSMASSMSDISAGVNVRIFYR